MFLSLHFLALLLFFTFFLPYLRVLLFYGGANFLASISRTPSLLVVFSSPSLSFLTAILFRSTRFSSCTQGLNTLLSFLTWSSISCMNVFLDSVGEWTFAKSDERGWRVDWQKPGEEIDSSRLLLPAPGLPYAQPPLPLSLFSYTEQVRFHFGASSLGLSFREEGRFNSTSPCTKRFQCRTRELSVDDLLSFPPLFLSLSAHFERPSSWTTTQTRFK